jgi:site-specific DNA-methyltransferase (adenine-specific)
MKYLSETYNRDCVEAMKEYPDNYFDLAVVDPPYGIGFDNTYVRCGMGEKVANRYKINNKKDGWDSLIPKDNYFIELFRVSKNQIIWGGNYFPYLWKNGCKGFIFWHKHQPVSNFAKGELAWTSFNKPANCFDYMYYGNINSELVRNHPTQKPVALYDWIFTNYAKPNDKILDTHLGSQSSRIAAYKLGLDFTGFELDKEYFEQGNKRFNDFLTVYEQEVGKEKILNNQTRLF